MKTILLASLLCFFHFTPPIYEFKINALEEGKEINFSSFKGKMILIVNTATKSPYTFQLQGLQQLYSAYKEKLVVVGFAAGDDFGDQDLKTNKEIRNFCQNTYGITFPMTEKTSMSGTMQPPIIHYLIEEARKMGFSDPVITGNFTKFLIDEKGQLVNVFPPDITPLSTEITSYLNNSRSWSLN